MFDFAIELGRTNALLERIAIACERIAGPEIPEEYVPRKTQPQDIGRVDMAGENHAMTRVRKAEEALSIAEE